jgi:DNA-binding response OmpR family regulator
MADNPAHCLMVVDDDPDLRATFALLFGREYRVLAAAGGLEALALLETENPELIVLDLMMPGMNGLETLKALKAVRPETIVIMLTSERDLEAARSALSLGASQFVTKPFDIDDLRGEIRRLLDESAGGSDPSGRPWKIAP